jgi:hypothetical protein
VRVSPDQSTNAEIEDGGLLPPDRRKTCAEAFAPSLAGIAGIAALVALVALVALATPASAGAVAVNVGRLGR